MVKIKGVNLRNQLGPQTNNCPGNDKPTQHALHLQAVPPPLRQKKAATGLDLGARNTILSQRQGHGQSIAQLSGGLRHLVEEDQKKLCPQRTGKAAGCKDPLAQLLGCNVPHMEPHPKKARGPVTDKGARRNEPYHLRAGHQIQMPQQRHKTESRSLAEMRAGGIRDLMRAIARLGADEARPGIDSPSGSTVRRIEQSVEGLAWAYQLLSWEKCGVAGLEAILREARDLNMMNGCGQTMLRIACEYGRSTWSDRALARILREPRLDLDLPDGSPAERHAERWGNRGAAEMIRSERAQRGRWSALRRAWIDVVVRASR